MTCAVNFPLFQLTCLILTKRNSDQILGSKQYYLLLWFFAFWVIWLFFQSSVFSVLWIWYKESLWYYFLLYLFSASCDLSSSMLGLKRTPTTSLHLVAHSGRVGVFSLEPILNVLVLRPSLSQRRNPIWLRSMMPSRVLIWIKIFRDKSQIETQPWWLGGRALAS